jgi:hypothetical protein
MAKICYYCMLSHARLIRKMNLHSVTEVPGLKAVNVVCELIEDGVDIPFFDLLVALSPHCIHEKKQRQRKSRLLNRISLRSISRLQIQPKVIGA